MRPLRGRGCSLWDCWCHFCAGRYGCRAGDASELCADPGDLERDVIASDVLSKPTNDAVQNVRKAIQTMQQNNSLIVRHSAALAKERFILRLLLGGYASTEAFNADSEALSLPAAWGKAGAFWWCAARAATARRRTSPCSWCTPSAYSLAASRCSFIWKCRRTIWSFSLWRERCRKRPQC